MSKKGIHRNRKCNALALESISGMKIRLMDLFLYSLEFFQLLSSLQCYAFGRWGEFGLFWVRVYLILESLFPMNWLQFIYIFYEELRTGKLAWCNKMLLGIILNDFKSIHWSIILKPLRIDHINLLKYFLYYYLVGQ